MRTPLTTRVITAGKAPARRPNRYLLLEPAREFRQWLIVLRGQDQCVSHDSLQLTPVSAGGTCLQGYGHAPTTLAWAGDQVAD